MRSVRRDATCRMKRNTMAKKMGSVSFVEDNRIVADLSIEEFLTKPIVRNFHKKWSTFSVCHLKQETHQEMR